MCVVTVALIGWDVYVATNKIPNSLDTISGRMRDWGKQAIILPWAWAVLFGHFFGPVKAGQYFSNHTTVPILVFISWAVLVGGMWLRQNGIFISSSWYLFFGVLNLGALAGAFLWPQ